MVTLLFCLILVPVFFAVFAHAMDSVVVFVLSVIAILSLFFGAIILEGFHNRNTYERDCQRAGGYTVSNDSVCIIGGRVLNI